MKMAEVINIKTKLEAGGPGSGRHPSSGPQAKSESALRRRGYEQVGGVPSKAIGNQYRAWGTQPAHGESNWRHPDGQSAVVNTGGWVTHDPGPKGRAAGFNLAVRGSDHIGGYLKKMHASSVEAGGPGSGRHAGIGLGKHYGPGRSNAADHAIRNGMNKQLGNAGFKQLSQNHWQHPKSGAEVEFTHAGTADHNYFQFTPANESDKGEFDRSSGWTQSHLDDQLRQHSQVYQSGMKAGKDKVNMGNYKDAAKTAKSASQDAWEETQHAQSHDEEEMPESPYDPEQMDKQQPNPDVQEQDEDRLDDDDADEEKESPHLDAKMAHDDAAYAHSVAKSLAPSKALEEFHDTKVREHHRQSNFHATQLQSMSSEGTNPPLTNREGRIGPIQQGYLGRPQPEKS